MSIAPFVTGLLWGFIVGIISLVVSIIGWSLEDAWITREQPKNPFDFLAKLQENWFAAEVLKWNIKFDINNNAHFKFDLKYKGKEFVLVTELDAKQTKEFVTYLVTRRET